jgi:hypothetical protein
MSTKFAVTIRCLDCGKRYKRTMEAETQEALAALPDPECPSCSKPRRKSTVGEFKFNGKAPAVGGSLTVRAVDATAKIVMEDHGMTDLRSDVREGESMAPKLPPKQQALADGFFAGHKRPGAAGMMGLSPQQVMKAAVGGRFNTPDTVNPVAIQHKKRESAPIHYVNSGKMN